MDPDELSSVHMNMKFAAKQPSPVVFL